MARRARILVVEDDRDFRATLAEWLDSIGYAPLALADGRAALAALRGERFDLMLADLHLPDMSGVELMRRVKAIDPQLDVVILTGHGTLESAIEALRGRAFDFILKPPRLAELKRVIDRALAERRRSELPGGRPPSVPLTALELQMLRLVADGLENRAIAEALELSERAVRNHMSGIFAKLGVDNRTKAVLHARQAGVL